MLKPIEICKEHMRGAPAPPGSMIDFIQKKVNEGLGREK